MLGSANRLPALTENVRRQFSLGKKMNNFVQVIIRGQRNIYQSSAFRKHMSFLSTTKWISYKCVECFSFFSWKISVYIELRWRPWGRMIYYLLSLCAWKKALLSNDKIHNRTWSVSWCYPWGLRGGVSTVCRHTNPQVMLTSHNLKSPDSAAHMSVVWVGGRAPRIDFCLVHINAH